MLGNVDSTICRSGVVENVRVAVGDALLSLSVHELLLGTVSTCHFWVAAILVLPVNRHTRQYEVILYSVHLATVLLVISNRVFSTGAVRAV